ncbi:MAG: kelch repeat-containing protein [Bryobacteraceae bacterium]|jgi:hypothetical protein
MRLQKTLAALALALLAALPLPGQNQVNLTVDATMDIYRAGGYNDGSNGIAPVVFSFPARAWRTMKLPSVGGAWSCQNGYPDYGADGETSGYCVVAGGPTNFNSIGPLSGYHLTDFVGALAGVFLEDTLPASAAPALRFYVSDNSEGGIQTDFPALSPQIGQVFFIGDGLTGTGSGEMQTFKVPPTATHLYLGYVDNCMAPGNTAPGCYSDNVGSLNLTVRLQDYVPDWVEPTLSSAPSARDVAAMTYDSATYSTVLFGGSSAFFPGVSYGDTWIWRRGWTQLSPAASPPERGGAGMAYDPATGTVVLFGGSDNSSGAVLGDTWTWDGVTWTQQFPPVSPPARSPRYSMVYDAATETVLLFGGLGASTGDYGAVPFGDTWEWNGRTKTWTQQLPSSSPSPRSASLAYDPIAKTAVLFGGDNGGGDCCRIYYNDTWTWDGVNWTELSPASSPTARTAQSMAFDATLGQVVVFGGTSGPPQALNDTWGWNGTTWIQLSLANQPSARYWPVMDFDPLSDGLVLFGGELTGDVVTNQTWLLVPVPIH